MFAVGDGRVAAHRRSGARRTGGRRRWVRASTGAVGVAAIIGALVLFGSTGYPATRPHLLSGSAWLASSQVGQLTLLDGSSVEVAAQVPVAPRGTRLDVVQQGATAYAVNGVAGSIRRVDGATFAVTQPVVPISGAGDGLRAFAGTDVVYALDTKRGVLSATDPRTLAPRSGPVSLAAQLAAQAATIDDAGRLWLLDAGSGDLIWVRDGQRHSRRAVTRPGAGTLVLAGGAPVLVDTATRTAAMLDPATGETRRITGLDLRPDDRVEVSGAAGAARLYVVARGVLAVCDLTASRCPTLVPLAGAGADLGAAVESGRRVFVPDYATGRVWIVDLDAGRVVAQPAVVAPHIRFQLLNRDGVVFFNDPDSEHAGVIHLDGGVKPVAKYDPRKDGGSPAGKEGKPTATKPPPPSRPGPTPTPSGTQGAVPAAIRIAVSTNQPRVGEDITFGVAVDSGPAPTGARWDFGDGATATGLPATHRWGIEGTFLVSVRATFADGRSAVASLSLQVTVRPPVIATLSVAVGGAGSGSVTSLPGGISCPSACTGDFAVGSTVQLTAFANGSSNFTGWGGACVSFGAASTCTVTMVAGGVSVSANLAVRPRLRMTTTAGGTITGDFGIFCQGACQRTMNTGDRVTLTATPDANFDFTGWGGACTGMGSCMLTMDGDKDVSASFRSRGPLPAPVQLSPDDGAHITHQQRLEMVPVPLVWGAVPGAAQYEAESESVSFVTGQHFGNRKDLTSAAAKPAPVRKQPRGSCPRLWVWAVETEERGGTGCARNSYWVWAASPSSWPR
ncbi:MAG: hypothetical protein AUI14_04945 [Actinobacteria bacterium 13_2_20CM_2_71_6]|nr:MAG: hypothetical protein AUI14_04945 [Actinobacteria bacterium 13_2_20CM_2_71_6]